MPVAQAIATYRVWVDGTDVSQDIAGDIETITVENNLYLPDTFALRLRMKLIAGGTNNKGSGPQDRPMRWLDDPTFSIGKSLKIQLIAASISPDAAVPGRSSRSHHNIDGEITELEVDMEEDSTVLLTVRGYDRSYLLQQGNQIKSYIQMTDSDIVKQISKEVGLQVDNVESTTEVYDYVLEANQTHLDFLKKRAARIGYELFVDEKKVYFRERTDQASDTLEMRPDTNLLAFHARQNSAGGKIEVTVRGWDPLTNREVVGKAAATKAHPTHILSGSKTPGESKTYQFSRPVTTQSEAEQVAQGLLDYLSGNYMRMEGTAYGHPSIQAGNWIEIKGFGGQFNGNYYLTSTTHVFTNGRGGHAAGYTVSFISEGGHDGTLLEAAGGSNSVSESFAGNGPIPAIVTNLKDPKNMGRVKVRWPQIGPDVESNWARVASPNQGMIMRPPVDQEVLMAFEDGDLNKPYILGTLWNSKTAPPFQQSNSGGSDHIGTHDHFVIQTPKNNMVVLYDSPNDGVALISHDGPTVQVLDNDGNSGVLISTDVGNSGDCLIEMMKADNSIKITTKGKIEIESQSDITMKGMSLKVDIQGNMDLSASGKVTIKGVTIDLN